jgi:hypothetical protein
MPYYISPTVSFYTIQDNSVSQNFSENLNLQEKPVSGDCKIPINFEGNGFTTEKASRFPK